MAGFTEYTLTAGRFPLACCLGPDGNTWYVSNGGAARVCKITSGGTVTEYACPDTAADLQDICSDGTNLWVLGYTSNKIYKVTTAGSFTSYSSGITASAGLYTICLGPDGNLWFTEISTNKVGKITTSGTVTEYTATQASSTPLGICSDGTDLWVTYYATGKAKQIAKVTTSGTFTEYTLPSASCNPSSMVLGSDGNLWICGSASSYDKIIKFVPSTQATTTYSTGSGTRPFAITAVQGDLVVLLYGTQKLARYTIAGAQVGSDLAIPTGSAGTQSRIAAGNDASTVWFCEYSQAKIGKYAWDPLTITQGLTVGVKVSGLTTTQGLAVHIEDATAIQRQARGTVSFFDGTSAGGTANDFSHGTVSGGKLTLTSTWTTFTPDLSNTSARQIPWSTADNGGGWTKPQLYNGSVSTYARYTTANSAYAAELALAKDANNFYLVRVGKGTGGSTELISCKVGTPTVRATLTNSGFAINSPGLLKLSFQSGVLSAYVNGSLVGSWTDTSPLTDLMPYVGATSASGSTSGNEYYTLAVNSPANTIKVFGVSGTQAARLYDSSNTVLASSGTQSGGAASFDTSALSLSSSGTQLTGYIKVFADNTYATQVTGGRFPAYGNLTDIGDGDYYYLSPSVDVVASNLVQGYPFYQIGSHSSVVQNPSTGEIFVAGHGNHGSVVMMKGAGSTQPRAWTSYEVAPAGTLIDQHENVSLVATSDGTLHLAYGGYQYATATSKYCSSTNPWDISAWSGATDLGVHGDVMLMVDQADKLHLIGGHGTASGSGYGDQLIYMSKASGGSWSGITVIANTYSSNWYFYLGDCAIGKETSGQQSLHFTAWTYNAAGSPVEDRYRNCFYFRSTDGGSHWKGLTGSNYTLPLSQASTGLISTVDTLASGEAAYVSRLGIDPDNTTVHLVVPVRTMSPDANGNYSRDYRYYQGNTTSGWAASAYTFPTTQLGVIENVNGQLIYITSTGNIPPLISTGYGTNIYTLQRFRASNSAGSAWTQDTAYTPPTTDGTLMNLYPRLTPISGAAYVNLTWVQWSNMLQGGGQGYTGTGQSSILTTTVFANFATIQGLAVAVITNTKTLSQGLRVSIYSAGTKQQGLAVAIGASAQTKTQGLRVNVTGGTNTVTQGLRVSVTAAALSTANLSVYGGKLAFPATSDSTNSTVACIIPLYIKSYNVPTRKPNFTEVVTSRVPDSGGFNISSQYMFETQPAPLQTTISGFFKTPTSLHYGKKIWNPTTDGTTTGTSLGLVGMSYAELVAAYFEGRASASSTGFGTRINPSYFIDPYGTTYTNVKIVSFDADFTTIYKKQSFTMTLVLEP